MKNLLSTIICLTAIAGWHPAQSDDFINWKPLLKDSVASNPGLESITPLLNFQDRNSDGTVDKVIVSFTVWMAGTTTRLFKTKAIGKNLPPVPCTNPVSSRTDYGVKFTNETGGRNNIVILHTLECTESGTLEEKQSFITIVYSADVTQSPAAGGNAWLSSWNADAVSFNLRDWDADTQEEIILALANDQSINADARVVILDQSDGTVEADNVYRIVNLP